MFFSDNAADGEITGVEGDFTYYTNTEGLTVSGAFSMINSEITKKLVPTDDVVVGDDLSFAPGYQANLNARYEWALSGGNVGHVMGQVIFTDDSFSDVITINRAMNEGYSKLDLRAGISNDEYTAEIYIDTVSYTHLTLPTI